MSSPSPEVRAVVRRMMGDAVGHADTRARVEVAERMLDAFDGRLSSFVGKAGFRLLLSRALRRAQREHTILQTVSTESETNRYLPGLEEQAALTAPEAVAAAVESLMAELIALVARFLGADLAIRMVRESIPDLSQGALGPDRAEPNND